MSDESISKRTVRYRVPGMDEVEVRRDVALLAEAGTGVTVDVYLPPRADEGARVPAVVLVSGYPDDGFERIVGCRFKEMGSTVSWGRLIAACGMVAIAYSGQDPEADLDAVLAELASHGAEIGVDGSRVGLWASSGNGPVAVSRLMKTAPVSVACAVLCYAYTLDLDEGRGVAEAARTFRFANPGAGSSIDDLRTDVPILVVRAGRDECKGLNDALDRFLFRAFGANLPVAATNLPAAPHAFDLVDGRETREAVRQILAFLQHHLLE
jgi:acetyl esterase/lipase